MQLWKLVSLKSVRQTSRLETQVRVNAAVLRQSSFFSGKPVLAVKAFN